MTLCNYLFTILYNKYKCGKCESYYKLICVTRFILSFFSSNALIMCVPLCNITPCRDTTCVTYFSVRGATYACFDSQRRSEASRPSDCANIHLVVRRTRFIQTYKEMSHGKFGMFECNLHKIYKTLHQYYCQVLFFHPFSLKLMNPLSTKALRELVKLRLPEVFSCLLVMFTFFFSI